MSVPADVLAAARAVLLVDYPSRVVPDTLVRAGRTVFVKSGPGPGDFTLQRLQGEEVVARLLGQAPDHVDLVYAHRPLAELPGIVELAKQLGASAIWREFDPAESAQARRLVEEAGLRYVDEAPIVDLL